ncbi:uncharacterized protein KZ484_000738 isoform 2-T2 [Pholidichthys leucotaenia]
MDDFDLSQALEDRCYLEKNDIKIEKEDEVIKLEEGLELTVSRDRKTMKSVSNLVLVNNKMRRLIPPELRGDALCREIMEYVANETIFKPVQNSSGGKFTLHRVASMECSLTDSSQKAIILAGESKLEAITLRGGEYERKVLLPCAQVDSPAADNILQPSSPRCCIRRTRSLSTGLRPCYASHLPKPRLSG